MKRTPGDLESEVDQLQYYSEFQENCKGYYWRKDEMINLKEEIMQLKAKIKQMEQSPFIKVTVDQKKLSFPTKWVEHFYVRPARSAPAAKVLKPRYSVEEVA